jgi:uncharacterized lipoprotein YmbA
MISTQLRAITRWITLLSICAILPACIGKNSPDVTYYSLLSMEQMGETAGTRTAADLRIGIGPITIPDALKRSQLVTRNQQNIYQFDEFHRWVGILEKDFAYVLGDNLEGLLGADKIAFYPWMHHFNPTHRVSIDIIQFDGELSGEAVLSARWAVADATGKINLASGRSIYRQAVEPGDYFGLVRTESRLLADLSRKLAGELQKVAMKTTQNPPSPLVSAPEQSPPGEVAILQAWSGDYPVAALDRLPAGQRQSAVGFIGDPDTFATLWTVFKPNEKLPEIDFRENLVVFARNVAFYNRTSIFKVTMHAGVAEVLAMETMSAMPVVDKAAMALAVVPRAGIKEIKTGETVVPVD